MVSKTARLRPAVVFAITAGLLIACERANDNDPVAPDAEGPPTYYGDIEPILQRHCVACHATPEVERKIVLSSYEGASAIHTLIADAVVERKMPPFGPDQGGACGSWTDARWLTDSEIALLQGWSAADAPMGDPRAAGESATPVPPAREVHPTHHLDIGGDFTPTFDHVVRCFIVDPQLPSDMFLKALRVQSNRGPWSVQQATLYSLDSVESETEAEALDAEEPGPGYDCIAGPLVAQATLLTGWTWGSSTMRLPDDTGLRVRGGRKLVFQLHYNTVLASAEPDRTVLALELAEQVPREARMVPVGGNELAPRPANPLGTEVLADASLTLDRGGEVLGLYPRMRLFGNSMLVEKTAGEGPSCWLSIPRWDFHGKQRLFVYDEPRAVAAGDTLRVTCSYITSARDRPISSGNHPDDEECTAYVYLVDP
jgi:hypothetical protein